MNAVQVDQKSYEMPPREGISVAQFLTGEALGFDPITSTLIFGEHDAVLVDAMTTRHVWSRAIPWSKLFCLFLSDLIGSRYERVRTRSSG
jgi:hypothetical protein